MNSVDSLSDYISQYSGHQRFYRLESIIEHGNLLSPQTVEQAINLGYQLYYLADPLADMPPFLLINDNQKYDDVIGWVTDLTDKFY